MTGTINKTLVLGRLGADPEIHLTENGKEIVRLSIATNERFTDKNGEKQERTEWHRLVIFREGLIAKVVKPYLKKGSKVFAEGALRTDSFEDKQGVKRFSTDVIVRELTLLDAKQS